MEDLKDKKILVTGGAGFIGSHIVDKLVSLGAGVVVVDDLSTGFLRNLDAVRDKITFIEGSFRDKNILVPALEGVAAICHQAALRSVPKSLDRPLDFHHLNVTGMLELILTARDAGIRRIVYASSSSVYGNRVDFPERESERARPISPYAATKLMGEHYAYVFSHLYDMEIVSLRYFNVFGPRQPLEGKYAVVVPKFITCLLQDAAPPIFGDGNQERDFTYVDDIVRANLTALSAPHVAGEVFNVSGGSPQAVNKTYAIVSDILKKDIAPRYLPPRAGDVGKTCADISRARKIMGWEPKTDFRTGLEKTAAWFKDHIGWFVEKEG